MRINGMRRWWRVSRWFKKQFTPQALILMYHRVAELPSDPQLLAVSPQHFADHLAVIQQYYHPLQLTDLVFALRDRYVPRRSVVLTFDDGYADNFHNASPLLAAYDIPATVFVTAGHVGCQQEFWWDELERLLLQPGGVPSELRLNVNGARRTWTLGAAAVYTKADYEHHRDWHIEWQNDPGPRQSLYRSLYHLLHAFSQEERQKVLDALRVWAGATPTGRPTHRALTVDELIQLDENELVEVGAHTMTHPLLASLPPAAQRTEIQQSKEHLEAVLNRPIVSFAYPHGSYTAETVTLLQQTGFVCACSSRDDAVWRGDDCFQLPRVVVRDWDGETFAGWLREWLGD